MLRPEQYFQTTEFARICGTTRRTLFYYDEIDLLKPAYTDANHCRYYKPEQSMTFLIINSLKEFGMNLETIRTYIQNPGAEGLHVLLMQQQAAIQEQQKKLEHMQIVINTRLSLLRQQSEAMPDSFEIVDLPEEYYILSQAVEGSESKSAHHVLFEHLNDCRKNNIGIGCPFSAMIDSKNLEAGITDIYAYYCTKINAQIASPFLHTKPRGTYAVAYLFGNYTNHHDFYMRMVKRIHALGYICVGYSYKDGIADEISAPDSEHYITKVSVQVDRPSKAQSDK